MPIDTKIREQVHVFLKERFKPWSAYAVILLHLVGFLGLALPQTRNLFLWLTPFHLILIFGVLFLFEGHTNHRLAAYIGFSALIGFMAEVVGVRYGWLFGVYSYGDVLGWQLWDVPLLIGLNWTMLAYCATSVFAQMSLPIWQNIGLSALLLVGFDACLEPAAMGLGFWVWPKGYVPGHNYLGWWLTAVPICALRYVCLPTATDVLPRVVWWSQFFFFFALSRFIFPNL